MILISVTFNKWGSVNNIKMDTNQRERDWHRMISLICGTKKSILYSDITIFKYYQVIISKTLEIRARKTTSSMKLPT